MDYRGCIHVGAIVGFYRDNGKEKMDTTISGLGSRVWDHPEPQTVAKTHVYGQSEARLEGP